jgi:hypothetical protein
MPALCRSWHGFLTKHYFKPSRLCQPQPSKTHKGPRIHRRPHRKLPGRNLCPPPTPTSPRGRKTRNSNGRTATSNICVSIPSAYYQPTRSRRQIPATLELQWLPPPWATCYGQRSCVITPRVPTGPTGTVSFCRPDTPAPI